MRRDRGEEIKHHLVVDLDVTHTDSNRLIELGCDLMIHLSDSSWHDTSVLVLSAAASHGKGLASTGLSIAHYSAIVSLNDTGNQLLSTSLKYLVLPIIISYHQSISYVALLRIFSNLNFHESVWLLTTPASSLLSMLTAMVYTKVECEALIHR
jgi:hypothetical protein